MTIETKVLELNYYPRVVHIGKSKPKFENTLGKGEIAHNGNFFFSHSFFYPFGKLSTIFINLKLSAANSFSLQFVVWERAKISVKILLFH